MKNLRENLPLKSTLGNILGMILIGLSCSMIWWVLSLVIKWSGGENIIGILLPLILSIIVIPLEFHFRNNKIIRRIVSHWGVLIGLLGQVVLDWLIYLKLHRILGFDAFTEGGMNVTASGWMSTDVQIMTLLSIWFAFTFLLVLPGLLLKLSFEIRSKQSYRQSWYGAWIIFGLLMANRWGGPWSGSFNHMIYVAILLPLYFYMAWPIPKFKEEDFQDNIKLPFISLIGYIFIAGYWLTVLEGHAQAQLSDAYSWYIPVFLNVILFGLTYNPKLLFTKYLSNKYLLMGLWLLMEISFVCLGLASIIADLMELRLLFLMLGFFGFSIFPECLIKSYRIGKQPVAIITFVASIAGLVGIIFPYAVYGFDPLGSYIVVIFAVLNGIMTIPALFLQKKLKKL